jgi:lipopolysaccharide transport protein LptA
MKTFFLCLAIFVISPTLRAQETNITNTAAAEMFPASTNSLASTNRIEIFSDSAEFLIATNIAVYSGNVRAFYSDTKLTCDILTLHVPKGGERPDYMIADRNVVIDTRDKSGKPIHAVGDKAVYTFSIENGTTNELMVLSGDAFIQLEDGSSMRADPIIWNLAKGTVNVIGPHMTINQSPKPTTSTNKPPASLNQTNKPAASLSETNKP